MDQIAVEEAAPISPHMVRMYTQGHHLDVLTHKIIKLAKSRFGDVIPDPELTMFEKDINYLLKAEL